MDFQQNLLRIFRRKTEPDPKSGSQKNGSTIPKDKPEPFAGIARFVNKKGVPRGAKTLAGVEGIFWSNEDSIVHKWHHYLPIYERYFAPYRYKSPRFLEIGVSKGGSLSMWRTYFGPDAVIFGIDIDPSCADLDEESGQVRIGSDLRPKSSSNFV